MEYLKTEFEQDASMILRTIPRQAARIVTGLLVLGAGPGLQAWGQAPLPITRLPDSAPPAAPKADGPKSAKPGKAVEAVDNASKFPGSDVTYKLTLGTCIHMALEKQPRLQALRAASARRCRVKRRSPISAW